MHPSAISPRARRAMIFVSLAAAAGCATLSGRSKDKAAGPPSPPVPPLPAAAPLSCPAPAGAGPKVAVHGNPGARRGAQRGLGFVAREASDWQQRNQCYGCHVQAVTLEALSIGLHNQYEVPKADLATIASGLTTIKGGSRGPNGLSVGGDAHHLIETSKEFGGAAFARYDALAGPELRDDLLKTADELTVFQDAEGSLRTSDRRFPVETGPMQATTQAMQTWRQAFERSADEKWLAPLRKAEGWLQAQARRLAEDKEATIVDLDYAAIGLSSAGAQTTEGTVRAIAGRLRSLAHEDGGFSFQPSGPANAFATGQTLYALRLLGAVDDDPVVAHGTEWLLAHQAEDGGWSHSGSDKAEAMWAVLGLVSIDVLSVSVGGIEDGQHAAGRVGLQVRAADNANRGVERVEIAVDDITVHRACGGTADWAFDTGALAVGPHLVDVTATNARGQQSRRRFQIYTGDYYLTQLGTRFSDGGTLISLRDVAPPSVRGEVVLTIYATEDRDGRTVRAAPVHREARTSAEGPLTFFWKGEGRHGRFLAEVFFNNEARTRTLQALETTFVHDTLEHQHAAFGEVEGSLSVNGAAPAANTQVELVDEQGRVVQSAVTTNAGNYRFRNVDGGKYKVRVQRQGFKSVETDVSAAASAAPAAAKPMDLHQ
jgi:squalene-hopene/tetraprenyl-beta-curcumene cyclase